MFFNPGDVFRRRRFNGHGDRNDFIVVGQDTLDEWLHEARFPGLLGKLPPRPYLTVRAIARALASGGDGLLAEEALLRLGHGTVTGAFRPEQWAPHRRRRPPSVVEDAKALLCARFTEHLTLEELGRAVNVSPFHLARSFRRHTGFTLHEYRVNLRLKAALERLAAGDEDVAVIARAVGFSSHSHLTATFHRAFGIPPSCVRKRSPPPRLDFASWETRSPPPSSPGRTASATARRSSAASTYSRACCRRRGSTPIAARSGSRSS